MEQSAIGALTMIIKVTQYLLHLLQAAEIRTNAAVAALVRPEFLLEVEIIAAKGAA